MKRCNNIHSKLFGCIRKRALHAKMSFEVAFTFLCIFCRLAISVCAWRWRSGTSISSGLLFAFFIIVFENYDFVFSIVCVCMCCLRGLSSSRDGTWFGSYVDLFEDCKWCGKKHENLNNELNNWRSSYFNLLQRPKICFFNKITREKYFSTLFK